MSNKENPVRRILVIAAGPSGVACATRLKRRLGEDEINVILPASAAKKTSDGPAGRRFQALLPNHEALASRELGVLEANDIMPDLQLKEITLGSSRGNITIRYTDLVLEVPATVRIPRPLQKAANVFPWPMPGFAADPAPCDAALEAAATGKGTVLVVGNGMAAFEALLLAREAQAPVHWLRTGEKDAPALEKQLVGTALKALGQDVLVTDLPETAPERLAFALSADGQTLESVRLPDGTVIAPACCFWTSPLMARHPILREQGVVLDEGGRITISEPEACPGLHLMGGGAVVSGARLPFSGVDMPSLPGGRQCADISGWNALHAVLGTAEANRAKGRGHAVQRAQGAGLTFCRAGLCLAEAQARGLEVEYAAISLDCPGNDGSGQDKAPSLALSLVCDKASRSLLGVQVLGLNAAPDLADGLFCLGLAALTDGTRLEALAERCRLGLAAELLGTAASVLLNKLETIIQGINPDEFLASRDAGAEFFTLDLRNMPDWRQGHVPGAYNIPLPQLKKRIQDEVPRFTPLVLVSASGKDAYVAACRMAGLGAKDLYVLDGGMRLWPYDEEQDHKV